MLDGAERQRKSWELGVRKAKKHLGGVPVVAQRKRIRLGIMRLWVQSPASLSGLRIWGCHELCCRSQMRLRSGRKGCISVEVWSTVKNKQRSGLLPGSGHGMQRDGRACGHCKTILMDGKWDSELRVYALAFTHVFISYLLNLSYRLPTMFHLLPLQKERQ